MCDCVPSTPLTSHRIRNHNLGPTRYNSNPSLFRTECLRKFNHRNLVKSSNFCNSDRFKSCAKVRSENCDSFDELGFTEKLPKGFGIETKSEEGGEVENLNLNSTLDSGIGFGSDEKEEIRSSEELGSSSLDFLELKSDLENEKARNKSWGCLEDEELVQVEGSNGVGSKSEELGNFVGNSGLRRGRQVIRRSNMLAKQVISVQSALSLGFVSQLWVDTSSWVVVVVEVRPSLLSGEIERFLLEDVCQIGDVVLVQDENVMENDIKMIGLDTLVGYKVVTPSRRNIGKVRGYTFNINSGALELLELDSFGISIIPSSLVSTYALFVEDVIEVAFDTVVVHEVATSRLQRLTRGIWETRSLETPKDELEEYSDFATQPVQSDYRRSSRKQKFPSKTREIEDEWDFPMDYL